MKTLARLRWLLPLLALAAALPVLADIVITTDGVQLEGRVTETDTQVIVEVEYGRITLERDRVQQIIRRESPLEAFERRRGELAADDAQGFYELGVWAREQGLERSARESFERAVEIDPDHAAARRALGHEQHRGGWLTPDELQRLRGFVEFDGAWVSSGELVNRLRQAELTRDREIRRARALETELEGANQAVTALRRDLERAELEAEQLERTRNTWQGPPFLIIRPRCPHCRRDFEFRYAPGTTVAP